MISVRTKDTASHMPRALSWQCLCAYFLLALIVVLGLYTSLHWQFQSTVGIVLHAQQPSPPEFRIGLWLFVLGFIATFAGAVVLHYVFVSQALKRLADTMEHEFSRDIAEQAPSPLPSDTQASSADAEDTQAEEYLRYEQQQATDQYPQTPTPIVDSTWPQSRANSEFLASMSRDIRAPMDGIIGITRELLETSLDDNQQQYMRTLQKATQDITRMMDDLHDFAKLETPSVRIG